MAFLAKKLSLRIFLHASVSIALLAATGISCSIGEAPADAAIAASAAQQTRGYFISIDGLQPRLLESYLNSSSARAGGFKKLWSHGTVFSHAKAHMISITAASHASTATCSSPAKHGITGNHFLRGHKRVSGFKEPLNAETMWQAARRQGKKVASFAYVAVDGSSPERSADIGITYPDDSMMGKPAVVTLTENGGKPVELVTTLDPAKDVKVTLKFSATVATSVPGKGARVDYTDLAGKNHTVTLPGAGSRDKTANILIHDGERMRKILIRRLASPEHTWLVSRASYNAAHPDAFRRSLDEAGLVWPDVNIKGLDVDLAPSDAVAVQGSLDDFITEVAVKTVKETNPDIVLFYQPLIDSTGHGFQNKLPDTGNIHGKDAVSMAFKQAFTRVDGNLRRLLSTSRPSDVVAMMGDHGMTATTDNLNVAPLLPAGIDKVFDVYGSDSMLYLYPVAGNPDPVQMKQYGQKLGEALGALTRNGKPVVEMVAEKSPENIQTWNYGDAAWAFRSAEGIWFVNNPLSTETFLPAKVPGIHGHNPDFASMHTVLAFSGPKVKSQIIREPVISLVDAVPTFAHLLNLDPPAHCEGKSLLSER
ncbi:MAG: hypothetical protein RIQ81_1864 [Pseudomonadota bacterium]